MVSAPRNHRLPTIPAVTTASTIAPSTATAAGNGTVKTAVLTVAALLLPTVAPPASASLGWEDAFWPAVSRATWTSGPVASSGRRRIHPGCSCSVGAVSAPPSRCAWPRLRSKISPARSGSPSVREAIDGSVSGWPPVRAGSETANTLTRRFPSAAPAGVLTPSAAHTANSTTTTVQIRAIMLGCLPLGVALAPLLIVSTWVRPGARSAGVLEPPAHAVLVRGLSSLTPSTRCTPEKGSTLRSGLRPSPPRADRATALPKPTSAQGKGRHDLLGAPNNAMPVPARDTTCTMADCVPYARMAASGGEPQARGDRVLGRASGAEQEAHHG